MPPIGYGCLTRRWNQRYLPRPPKGKRYAEKPYFLDLAIESDRRTSTVSSIIRAFWNR